MTLTHYHDIEPFTTKDGCLIRELMHPARHGNGNQSLAEATLPPGMKTVLHRHRESEEIYYFLSGKAMMVLGTEQLPVGPGDTVCIAPGVSHQLRNQGPEPLRLLCACAPPYRDDDTDLLE